DPSELPPSSQGCKVAKIDEQGTTRDFSRLREPLPQGSKTADLSSIHAVSQPCTLENGGDGGKGYTDQERGANGHPPVCVHCGLSEPAPNLVAYDGLNIWLHRGCEAEYRDDGLDIPASLRRVP